MNADTDILERADTAFVVALAEAVENMGKQEWSI